MWRYVASLPVSEDALGRAFPKGAHLRSCMCVLQSVRVRITVRNQQAPPTIPDSDLEEKGKKFVSFLKKKLQEAG